MPAKSEMRQVRAASISGIPVDGKIAHGLREGRCQQLCGRLQIFLCHGQDGDSALCCSRLVSILQEGLLNVCLHNIALAECFGTSTLLV